MARSLSEVLSRPPQEHYAKQFVNTFPANAGTPPEYIAIAADAYGKAQAEKVDIRLSTKVADTAEKAQATGADIDNILLQAAENAVFTQGKNKLIGTTPIERGTGEEKRTEHVIVTLEELVQQQRLKEDMERARKKPSGIKKV